MLAIAVCCNVFSRTCPTWLVLIFEALQGQCPWPCPCSWSQVFVLVFGLGFEDLGFGLGFEIKFLAIILRTVINFVYYWFIIDSLSTKLKRCWTLAFDITETCNASNCRCGSGFWVSLILALSFVGLGFGPKSLSLVPSPSLCSRFSCKSLALVLSLALNTKSLIASLAMCNACVKELRRWAAALL